MTEVRQAIDDSGKAQRLIRTFPRKGFRFVGQLREGSSDSHDAASTDRPSDPYRPVSQIISPERRPLTIMICNMIGLPAAAARLDPEDLREVMDAYRRCVGEIARRFEGFIARAGDGVLVYFGYPQAHEDDAERAVRAGLALTRAVSELQLECIGPLQVHVGIATGLTSDWRATGGRCSYGTRRDWRSSLSCSTPSYSCGSRDSSDFTQYAAPSWAPIRISRTPDGVHQRHRERRGGLSCPPREPDNWSL